MSNYRHRADQRALFAATPRFDRPGDLLQPTPLALTQRLDEEAQALDAHVRGNGG